MLSYLTTKCFITSVYKSIPKIEAIGINGLNLCCLNTSVIRAKSRPGKVFQEYQKYDSSFICNSEIERIISLGQISKTIT